MPTHFFPLTIITQNFEDETCLAEALNFHEISRFHTKQETALFHARLNAEQIIKDNYANLLHTLLAPAEIEIKEYGLEVTPPKKSVLWRGSLPLKFHVLETHREDGYCQAFVPALGIAVLTRKAADFESLIEREIHSALKRGGWLKSLQYLRWLERVESVGLQRAELAVHLPTAKQRAIAEEKNEAEEKSVLAEAGTDLRLIALEPAYEVEKQIELLAEILKAKQKTSILLVGPSGVGKTAIFHELVRRCEQLGLKDHQFWATSGARLIAGQSGFGMWQEQCRRLIAEARERQAIVHLGNLIELLEVGRSESSMQGIASFLRPKIARGEIVVLCECTPEQIPVIERRDPSLLGAFQQVRLEEPDQATSLKILGSIAAGHAQAKEASDAAAALEAVKTVDEVHRRFSTYSASPGRPTRFLRNLFAEQKPGDPLTPATVYRAFSHETGLPEMLLNDEIPLDLSAAQNFFAARVIGQPEAVELITKLIATLKAKLTRPRRPVASLLFIGPTGVGKTELTRALAEFFFSDPARLIRFDMSEFSNSLAVQRLIGGTGETEGQLTAKVREQPFSVVLLDEFEKAHHSFFDLLLQILGEGRLTDAAGRIADFTNTVIVMTSNLGASEFQRGRSGFTRSARERQTAIRHFDTAVKSFLRPEIYNRIDRIVPFAPLDKESVRKIAELEIEKLKRRDGLRFRPVGLEIDEDVLNHLAVIGYDVRYGARPLKRSIESELLAPLSAELNRRPANEKLIVEAALHGSRIALRFGCGNQPKKASPADYLLAALAERIGRLRRRMQKFLASYRLTELSDEIYQIVRLEALKLRGKWLSDEDRLRIERKPKIENFLKSAKEFAAAVNQSEDRILLEIYGRSAAGSATQAAQIEAHEKTFEHYLFELLRLQYPQPDVVKLSFFSEHQAALFRLLRLYTNYFQKLDHQVRRVMIFTAQKEPDQEAEKTPLFDRPVWRREISDPAAFFKSAPAETIGVLIEAEGPLALPRFGAESGIHRFAAGPRSDRVLIGTTEAAFEKFEIGEELARRDSVRFQPERRIYDTVQNQVKDLVLERTFSLDTSDLEEVFIRAIAETLQQTAENLIE